MARRVIDTHQYLTGAGIVPALPVAHYAVHPPSRYRGADCVGSYLLDEQDHEVK